MKKIFLKRKYVLAIVSMNIKITKLFVFENFACLKNERILPKTEILFSTS